MHRLHFGLSLGIALAASTAFGQEAELGQPAPVEAQAVDQNGELAPSMVSPEIYLYREEWRRHDDPAQAVRRKAEARSSQRMSRIAAMKWFGFSNARPQASTVPMMGTYSPAWIGNGYDRYDWAAVGIPSVTLRVERDNLRR